MGKKQLDPKLSQAIDDLLDVIAANVSKLVESQGGLKNTVMLTGVSKGSLQRILGGSQGYGGQKKSAAQIDTLLRLAWHFQINPVSLCLPSGPERRLGRTVQPTDTITELDLKSRRHRRHPVPRHIPKE